MEQVHSEDDASKQLESPYLHGINGEPQLLPRVGDQYQAAIPLLVPEYDRLNLIRCSGLDSHLVTFGLPIPLMWTRSEKFRGFREEAEIQEGGKPSSCHVSLEKSSRMKQRGIVLALPCAKNAKLKFGWLDKSLYPFPGTLGESWEDAEKQRFLLGLYFLGKNLVLLQRFVGSKKMGDMLSYYYGSFYRSNEYKRWVDGRKSRRSRRSVQGHKLLTGWRQQELLSRISWHVSEECKSMLLKVYKAFREDKIELEEYVFSLKNMIGLDMLTEAIGIGKGKKDLTLEATKLNPGASKVRIRNDLPVADIVKFLTGEYRMSKTRASDLFWEAVWPRLLARGWHSEQPEDGPNNSLVFLIPEANEFSRRNMSKGNHYFDSLTDVLNKVALDPTLLELNTDEDPRENIEEEIKNDPPVDIEESDDDSSQNNNNNKKKKRRRYLEPRIKTSKSQEVNMFTIVDTSGVEQGCTLKELRSLPIEKCDSIANPKSYSEDYQLSEESKNKADTTRMCGEGSISSGKSNSVNMDNSSTISLNERLQKNRKRGRPRNPPNRSTLAECAQKAVKKKKGTQMRPNQSQTDQNVVLMREEHIDQDQNLKLSSTGSSAEDSSYGRNEGRQIPPGRPAEIREDFDLNVSLEGEAVGVHNSESSCAQQSCIEMECKPHELQVSGPGPGRRQSTRTRPLTAKALEAFALGYLGNSEKKRKATEEPRRKYTKRIRKEQALNKEESSS